MFGSRYIFSEKFFTGWVVVGIIWIFNALACVGIFPVWEGRISIGHVIRAIFLDITGKKRPRSNITKNNVVLEGTYEETLGIETPELVNKGTMS